MSIFITTLLLFVIDSQFDHPMTEWTYWSRDQPHAIIMMSWGDKNIQVFASKPTLDQYHIDQLMPEPNIGTFQSNNVGKKSSVCCGYYKEFSLGL